MQWTVSLAPKTAPVGGYVRSRLDTFEARPLLMSKVNRSLQLLLHLSFIF